MIAEQAESVAVGCAKASEGPEYDENTTGPEQESELEPALEAEGDSKELRPGRACPLVTPPDPNVPHVIVRVGQKRFPIPLQADGWEIPAALRRQSIAVLWSIISNGHGSSITRIRAIEALVRLDGQALQADHMEDWRAVQQGKATRGNVRVLAELAKAKKLPKLSKSKKT